MINIEGLDKVDILKELYNYAKPQGFGFSVYTPQSMTRLEATMLLQGGTYFGYVNGRILNVDLSSDVMIDERAYERENGFGKVSAIISLLKDEKEIR